MLPFYTPWKYEKTSGFLMFSGVLEREHWPGMGQGVTEEFVISFEHCNMRCKKYWHFFLAFGLGTNPWTKDVNCTHIKCSEDVLEHRKIFKVCLAKDASWTSYERSIYVLCPRRNGLKNKFKYQPPANIAVRTIPQDQISAGSALYSFWRHTYT